MTMAPVYLVDDDEGVRGALSLLLGTYGIRIETFGDLPRDPQRERHRKRSLLGQNL